MTAEILKFDPANPERSFSRCREVILSGGVIAYPTDTFYGLGADPRNPAAVKRLFKIKGRQTDQPILLLLHDASAVGEWTDEITVVAQRLMREYWPGPLTLVFKACASVIPELTASTGSIGLRVPGSEFDRNLLSYFGIALTGTSANVSGGRGTRTARETADAVGGAVNLIIDAGPTVGGEPSTIVDVRTERLSVIREGAIPSRELRTKV